MAAGRSWGLISHILRFKSSSQNNCSFNYINILIDILECKEEFLGRYYSILLHSFMNILSSCIK